MTDERSPDLTQALLLELRAQLEEARRERDEARERARVSDQCRLANEAELRRADARIGLVRTALTNACDFAAQALLKEKALAAEKAALVARVGVLEAALRGLLAVVQHCYPGVPDICECDPSVGSVCECCADRRARDAARRALEVEP